jgi:hypothetical protein
MTPEIRQNTFYIFEQLAVLVYIYQSVSDASYGVETYMYNRIERHRHRHRYNNNTRPTS